MDTIPCTDSIFDSFYKLRETSTRLVWKTLSPSHKYKKQEIICCGYLQEADSIGLKRYYVATTSSILRFIVLSLLIFRSTNKMNHLKLFYLY